ncbi:MAG: PglZ domain-containing protein [Halanaerobiales bacterium]|nr:PglZ domain-containing protein [Halanaerobiales bacterium]
MLDKWFKEDINELFEKSNKVVLIDIDASYDFLVESLKEEPNIKVFKVDDYLSDLEVKYKIEKEYPDSKVLIHTSLKTSESDNRQYMIQEYVATGKEFNNLLNRYIRDKSGLQDSEVTLTEEELILAGKMSLKSENNNQEFWQNIKIQGRKAILGEFEDIALRFLADPEEYVDSLPQGGREHLYSLIGEYLEFTPEEDTDPKVVANDFADKMFSNIITGNKSTDKIYKNWLDSHKYRKKLKNYLSDFELPQSIDIWEVNPDHPFSEIDELWLEELSDLVLKNEDIRDHIITSIKERKNKREGMEITESYYWSPVYQLLTFEAKAPHKIEDLTEYVEFYKHSLYKLDQSYRYINQYLLNKDKPKRAFSALYKEKLKPYLDRWFELFSNYRENQSDYLYREIFSKDERKAVIIGDAISYEVSQEITSNFKDNKDYDITSKIINGNHPTTTANNMSALFGSPYYNNRSKRESYLKDKLNNELQILGLDNVNSQSIDSSKPAVIYGQDIDAISEKGHETALKYYNTFINTVVDKVKELLEAGYGEVHLLTDHGFVCNFDIDEADKYSAPVNDGKIKDRHVLSNKHKEDKESFVVKETENGEYNYVYYPKGVDPIKSKQQYGFAHGGITPQEILLPHLIFKKESSSSLDVEIVNKEQLKDIGASSFSIKFKAEEESDLFKTSRDIIVKIEDGGRTTYKQKFTIEPSEEMKVDLTLDLDRYSILIQDAVSKEIIDSVKGKKENLRGGLDDFDLD